MDEGFYLLASTAPSEYPIFSSFHFILSVIPHFSDNRIIDFRYCQLLAQVIGALLLGFGWSLWLRSLNVVTTKSEFIFGLLFGVLGNLLIFAKFPMSVSYNSLTGLFVFGSAGLILSGINPLLLKGGKGRTGNALLFIAGLFAGCTIFTKICSFAIFFPLAIIAKSLLVSSDRYKRVFIFFVGNLTALGLLLARFGVNAIWSSEIGYGWKYLATNHTFHDSLPQTYWQNILEFFTWSTPYGSTIAAVAFVLSLTLARFSHSPRFRDLHILPLVVQVVISASIAVYLMMGDFLKATVMSANFFYILAVLIGAQIFGAYLGSPNKVQKLFSIKLLIICFFLTALPFICAAGTSNSILFQGSIYSSAVFLLLYGLSKVVDRISRNSLSSTFTIVICTVCTVFQFYDGFVRHPYCLDAGLKAQTELTTLTNLKGQKLTKPLKIFFDELDQILRTNGYQSGDRILAFYNMPGVVYALGGSAPRLCWIFPFPGFMEYNRHYLSQIESSKGKHLFLIAGWTLNKTIIDALQAAGVRYPNDFRLIGKVKNPIRVGLTDGKVDTDFLDGDVQIYSTN